MSKRNDLLVLCIIVMSLVLLSCNVIHKHQERESIFDKIVNIPKELVLDIPQLPPLCDELPGLKKGFVDILDGKLYYEEEGQGVPLVLINGGPGRTHHGFHPCFSQIKDCAHIIYYDQRGTGKSSKDDSGKTYTIRQAIEDLESLRKALKIDRWVVLGWSYGGLLAQCYALTYPERVIGLVLIASQLGLFEPIMKCEREHMFISQAEENAIIDIRKKGFAGKITAAQSVYNQQLAGNWKRDSYYKPTKEEIIRNALLYEGNALAAPGFEELMRLESYKINLQGMFDDFEIPTLIIEAQWDLLWWNPGRAGLMRSNHPHAQVEIFEKAGHKIFADQPEKFFTVLKVFLAKSSRAHIDYKPGNRLAWPQQSPVLRRRVLVAQGSMDSDVWVRLIYDFIHSKKDYDKCLTALRCLEDSIKKYAEEWQMYGYCIQAWKGHMLDLLGKRDEAIACYNEAIKTNNGRSDNYFGGCMHINKQWLEQRLKIPFAWKLFKD